MPLGSGTIGNPTLGSTSNAMSSSACSPKEQRRKVVKTEMKDQSPFIANQDHADRLHSLFVSLERDNSIVNRMRLAKVLDNLAINYQNRGLPVQQRGIFHLLSTAADRLEAKNDPEEYLLGPLHALDNLRKLFPFALEECEARYVRSLDDGVGGLRLTENTLLRFKAQDLSRKLEKLSVSLLSKKEFANECNLVQLKDRFTALSAEAEALLERLQGSFNRIDNVFKVINNLPSQEDESKHSEVVDGVISAALVKWRTKARKWQQQEREREKDALKRDIDTLANCLEAAKAHSSGTINFET